MSEHWIEPPVLEAAQIGSQREQACTPPVQPFGWHGVALMAPVKVRPQGKALPPVPVCGRFNVHAWALAREMGQIFVRVNGHEQPPQSIWLGNPQNEAGPLGPVVAGAQFQGGYFAVDIGPYIHFPPAPARIEFLIEYGDFRSAPYAFDWVPPPPAQPHGH